MGLTSHLTSELFEKEEVFARSIVAKLWEYGRYDLAAPLDQCHQTETFCLCQHCHQARTFLNHCDRFYCPFCQAKLSFRRKQKLEWWARQVTDPKHLVLTIRNRNSLSHEHVKFFKSCLARLRRSKAFRPCLGGLVSLELTNEGKGWHLHAHLLLDSGYLPAQAIGQTWSHLVGQDFAIFKIKDTRDQAYLKEVTKYAVKGSQLSGWNGSEIVEFIEAFTGVRTFSTFGTLFKDMALRTKALDELSPNSMECPNCFKNEFWFLSKSEFDWFQTTGKLPKLSSYRH